MPLCKQLCAHHGFIGQRPMLLLALTLAACDSGPSRSRTRTVRPALSLQPTSSPPNTAEAASAARWTPKPETLEAITKAQGIAWHVWPRPLAPQRLAFFARNLAVLTDDSVWALPILVDGRKNPCRPNRLPIEKPRELTTLADQTLLVLGAKGSVMLDSNCQTTTTLPKVSYIPTHRLFPEPRWPRAFALFDASSGTFMRFGWNDVPRTVGGIFLPQATVDDPNLLSSICGLLPDGSLACVQGERLAIGWPGHPTRVVGKLASGAAVARVLPAERADHVRILRVDSRLEEYWLAPGLPQQQNISLPSVAFEISVGRGYIAILQVEETGNQFNHVRLVVLEPDGNLRWSLPIDKVSAALTEREWLHEYFECRSLLAHPTRPWIAVGNCDRIDLFDARSGQVVQSIDRRAR